MSSENLDLLKYLSGGIPVALLALLLVIVLWRDRAEREKAWEAKLEAKDLVIEAKDKVIEDLNARLLAQANDYSDEMISAQARLQDRMLTQWTENAPLFKQAVDVLKQALAELAIATASRQAGR